MTLRLQNISLALNGKALLKPFTLEIGDGEIVTLMGRSGSGKSSLFSLIAGDLQAPLEGAGRVLLDGIDLGNKRPEQRRIGRLFQDDLLFPHLSVAENLLFGVERGDGNVRTGMVKLALERAGLEGFEDRKPQTLSGGQRARISLMRALLAKPACMLLDEPFNKLDRELRASFRTYVFEHLKLRGIPALLVTHDIEDAEPGSRVFHIGDDGEVRSA